MTEGAARKTASRRRMALNIVVSVILTAALVYFADVRAVFARFETLEWTELVGLSLVVFAVGAFSIARWHYVLRAIGIPMPWADVAGITLFGNFVHQALLPVLGDAARIGLLTRRGATLTLAAGSVILDRTAGIMGLIGVVVAAGIGLSSRLSSSDAIASLALTLVVPCLLIGALLFFDRLLPAALVRAIESRADRAPWTFLWRLLNFARTVSESGRYVLLGLRFGPVILACSLIVQLAMCFVCWGAARALDVPLDFLDCLLVVPPSLLVSAVPLSIGGWGVREGAMAAGLVVAGVTLPDAVAVAVLFGGLVLAGNLPGAAFGPWLLRADPAEAKP